MKFRFDADQEHQLRAVESVVRLFDGQPKVQTELSFSAETGFAVVPNRLDLPEERLLANLNAVQERNDIRPDLILETIEEPIVTAEGEQSARFPNFSVEMETGTGKTYVYVRTALELYRRFGLRKYIVVVPSVAIREGVLKTLAITRAHFTEFLGNIPYRFYSYDSANLTQVRQFALSDTVEFMVMTIDSFNKATNVIRQTTDRLQGETPIHLVQAARPILILDEPQNMESEARVRALAALDPLMALRYSATHRNPYNLAYQLTPYEAYRQALVKRIEVAGVEEETNANRVFMRLDDVRTKKTRVTARIAVHKLLKSGTVKETVITAGPGDMLSTKANRSEYDGFDIEEIDVSEGTVRFGNGVILRKGEARGADREAIFEAQIRYTIESHFQRQRRLDQLGIPVKVLSLFFIDRVANYAEEDGIIRTLFDRAFNEIREKRDADGDLLYPQWEKRVGPEVRAGYFASRRTRSGDTVYEDSRTGEAQRDREAYDLIMKDKERLLSFEEPVSFIFSHSALREGWDNPNIFQICTLNQSVSDIRKRQEIGRGVRLAVNQEGERVRDESVNVLLVVANESYEKYVAAYQGELEDELGGVKLPPPPGDHRRKKRVRPRKEHLLSAAFKELWERIRPKTRYAVTIDSAKLIEEVLKELDEVDIPEPQVVIRKARVDIGEEDRMTAVQVGEQRQSYGEAAAVGNVVGTMTELMEHTTPPMRLTRRTLLQIVQRTANAEAIRNNPFGFASEAVAIIKRKLADQLVEGIRYEPTGELYEMRESDLEVEVFERYLIPVEKSVQDHVRVDTSAEDITSSIEGRFVHELEKDDAVLLYVKLPSWFTVDTPVGQYNPDWAIVMEERDEFGESAGGSRLYLVAETKGENWKDGLRVDEQRKIQCGARHFGSKQMKQKGALVDVEYRVVSGLSELR